MASRGYVPTDEQNNRPSHRRLPSWIRPRISWLIIAIGALILGFAGSKLWARWHTTHTGANTVPTVVTKSTDHPSETPISPTAPYKVAADLPRQISLPTIHAKGFIQRVTTDQYGNIAVPSNINLAGWYTASVKPGDPGVSIIDGHIGGYYKLGIFKQLGELKAGDVFSVGFGDGHSKSFKVLSVRNYSVKEATAHMLDHADDVTNQLTLITCGGRYIRSTQGYDQRTLVTSSLVAHK